MSVGTGGCGSTGDGAVGEAAMDSLGGGLYYIVYGFPPERPDVPVLKVR